MQPHTPRRNNRAMQEAGASSIKQVDFFTPFFLFFGTDIKKGPFLTR